MYILTYRLLNILNTKSSESTSYVLAEKLLKNIDDLAYLSIDQVAKECAVSKSTLSKFVSEFGFENYKDFRASAEKEKEETVYTNYEHVSSLENYLITHEYDQLIDEIIHDLMVLKKTIPKQSIKKLALEIYKAKNVIVLGSVYSQTASLELQYKIASMRKYICTPINDLEQEKVIRDGDEKTLFIIFSNSGQYLYSNGMKEFPEPKEYFVDSKSTICLITSNEKAAKDPLVDLSIVYSITSRLETHPFLYRVIINWLCKEYREISKRGDSL